MNRFYPGQTPVNYLVKSRPEPLRAPSMEEPVVAPAEVVQPTPVAEVNATEPVIAPEVTVTETPVATAEIDDQKPVETTVESTVEEDAAPKTKKKSSRTKK